jgi:hypothetical protein
MSDDPGFRAETHSTVEPTDAEVITRLRAERDALKEQRDALGERLDMTSQYLDEKVEPDLAEAVRLLREIERSFTVTGYMERDVVEGISKFLPSIDAQASEGGETP